MDIEEINSDRDKFLTNISQSVESELKKVGLKLINVNITDIVDESGYIEALGKEESYAAEKDAEIARAEAQGLLEILTKQAQGLDEIVKATVNNTKDAVLLLVADKLPELVRIQAETIKNIKIDKVPVWDSGAKTEDGKNSTANFISRMYKSVPPLQEMFNMAGMQLPEYLKGKDADGEDVYGEAIEVEPSKMSKPKKSQGEE